MSQESYKPLQLPPPPSPRPRTRGKAALKKTVSAPQAALSRLLLGSHQQRATEEEDEKEGGHEGKKKVRKKRPIEVGKDALLEDETGSAGPAVGDLINFDPDTDPPSAGSQPASVSPRPPSIRSASVSGRPSPQQLRRPPPPPPDRPRLATVSGALGDAVKPPGPPAKARPAPPPKPSYLSSPTHQGTESESVSVVAVPTDSGSDNGVTTEKTEPDTDPEAKPRVTDPSPYLVFMPRHKRRPEPPPRIKQEKSSPDHSPSTSRSTSVSSSSNSTTQPSTKVAGDKTNSSAPATSHHHPVTFPNPPPREMDYCEREHSRSVFERLDAMRRRGDLCDVTLVGSSREIRAHRAVLAACSPYFESMFIGEFSEPDGEPILVEEIEDDALEALVEFAYTSRIKLTNRNVYLIFAAADMLQFSGIRGACFKFFKQQMNTSNCIRTWLFGDGHNCTELIDASQRYVESNFLDVVKGREFLSVDRPDVVSRLLALEDIAVTSEEQVYEAALNWIRHDLEVGALLGTCVRNLY